MVFLLNVLRDIILFVGLGPILIFIPLVGNPAVETLFTTLGKIDWLVEENWKYLVAHVVIVTIFILLHLHAYTAFLILAVYWDITDRMLRFTCDALLGLQTNVITEKKIRGKNRKNQNVINILKNVCRTFDHQKILTVNVLEMIHTFIFFYVVIVLPVLIFQIYVTFKFITSLPLCLSIIVAFSLLVWLLMMVNVHTASSSLYEHSSRFIQIAQRINLLSQADQSYWKCKFRSFKCIKIGAHGLHFRNANLLPTLSHFAHVTITLLLL